MKYLFDTSSIFTLLEKESPEILLDNVTVNLAVFELGNILWKEVHIFKNISPSEMRDLQQYINDTLSIMQIVNIKQVQEEVLALAVEKDITFYDASYVYPTVANEWTFVTEDNELRKKVSSEVPTLSADQVLSNE